ncbi:hypothetical protein AE621_22460 [Acidovorax sp. SD340]|nr:hypothetical protein AE621_22460 [Acidovorax sp. SD340]
MFIPEADRGLALVKARQELIRRHWTFIKYEDRSTLIEARVREEGGAVLEAFKEALRGRVFFKVFIDTFGSGSKDRQTMLPARITEDFIDEVIIKAGGARLDTAGITPGIRNADYLLGRYIFELKDLQEEAMSKGPHQERLAQLFRPYARGEAWVTINPAMLSKSDFREYLNILGRPIQGHVRSAAKQIKETKKLLGRDDLLGGLLLLNTGFGTYPHDEFSAQVERYARKDTSEFNAVMTVSAWSQTNGFDTFAFYKISPQESQEEEIVAFQQAFSDCYMAMMTKLIQGALPAAAASAPASRSIGFAVDGIDFAWEAPRIPLPWERDAK